MRGKGLGPWGTDVEHASLNHDFALLDQDVDWYQLDIRGLDGTCIVWYLE